MISKKEFSIVDPIEHIKNNPNLYFKDGVVSGAQITNWICSIAEEDGFDVASEFYKGWWIISGAKKFIPSPDYFKQIVPRPQNKMRGEVLAFVFSSHLLFYENDLCVFQKGNVPDEFLSLKKSKGQTLTFKVEG